MRLKPHFPQYASALHTRISSCTASRWGRRPPFLNRHPFILLSSSVGAALTCETNTGSALHRVPPCSTVRRSSTGLQKTANTFGNTVAGRVNDCSREPYFSFAYSALACCRIGTAVSATSFRSGEETLDAFERSRTGGVSIIPPARLNLQPSIRNPALGKVGMPVQASTCLAARSKGAWPLRQQRPRSARSAAQKNLSPNMKMASKVSAATVGMCSSFRSLPGMRLRHPACLRFHPTARAERTHSR